MKLFFPWIVLNIFVTLISLVGYPDSFLVSRHFRIV